MRILYIHQYFKTRSDAGATRSYEFARRWVANGHQVTMLTADPRPAAPGSERIARHVIDGIEVLAIRSPYSNYMSFARRGWAFVSFMVAATWQGLRSAARPDLVYATSTPLTVGIPGLLVGLFRGAPFVFEIRDLWPEAPIQLGALRNPLAIWLARALERTLYRAARHVVTLSPGMHEALIAMGVPATKLAMLPNCSDLDLFQPGSASPELARRLGLANKFVVAYAGAMGLANGLMSIIQAASILQARREDGIHLVLIGDGSQRPALERSIADGGLHNITLLDPMPKQELAETLRISAAVLVSFAPYPVLETCSPNKLFDGLALGRPVLINYGGWMKALIESHDVGIAAASGRPEELADAILALAREPERAAAMGRRARALAETDYDRDALAAALLAILESVADQNGTD